VEEKMIKRKLTDLKYIVIHHSVTPEDWTTEMLRQLHRGLGYLDIGYHFTGRKGKLGVGRNILNRGAHTIVEKPRFRGIDLNFFGIGYCIIGDFTKKPPTDWEINEYAYQIKRIATKYKIPLDRNHIIGHNDASNTICPGQVMNKLYAKLGI
jgi:N-acetylmuramoyl-L-alanine amidase